MRDLMKRSAIILIALSVFPHVAIAQPSQVGLGPGPIPPACTSFGTTAGTCAQGNDSRFTEALQANPNIIFNGDMSLDQANAGSSVSVATASVNLRLADGILTTFTASTSSQGTFTAQKGTPSTSMVTGCGQSYAASELITANATPGSTTPAGVFAFVKQNIEGPQASDLGFGAAGGQTVTVSVCAKSSLASFDYPVTVKNQNSTRSFVHDCVTSSSAGTWSKCTFPITADTTGTWNTGINTTWAAFDISIGTGSTFQTTPDTWAAGNFLSTANSTFLLNNSSATFEFTGLKIERGTTPTAFVPDVAEIALAKAQRCYTKTFSLAVAPAQNIGSVVNALTVKNPIALGDPSIYWQFPVQMTTMITGVLGPTIVTYNPSAGNANWRDITAGSDATVSVDPASTKGASGVLIATSGTVTTLGDVLAIHATADSGC